MYNSVDIQFVKGHGSYNMKSLEGRELVTNARELKNLVLSRSSYTKENNSIEFFFSSIKSEVNKVECNSPIK